MITKILLFSYYSPPDLSAGSFRVAALLKEVKDKTGDVEIDCVTTMPNRYKEFSTHASQQEIDENIRIFRAKLPPHNNGMLGQIKAYFSYAKFTWTHLKNSDTEYDIVVATSSRLMTATLGAFWAWKKKLPLYLDIRDLFLDTLESVFQGPLIKLLLPFIRMMERWTFRRALKINVVSDGFHKYVRSIAPDAKISVIPNGIDAEFLEPLPVRRPSSPLRILYAGNIGEGQGLELVVPQAAIQLGSIVEFHIVGSGGRLDALKAAILKLDAKNIYVHNPLSRSELFEIYKKSDILYLQLNAYQAFEKVLPSKIFEYAATGRPLIAGVSGYAASFLREHVPQSYIVEPCNVAALVERVRAVKAIVGLPIDRSDFVKQFDRRKLMQDLLTDILSTIPPKHQDYIELEVTE